MGIDILRLVAGLFFLILGSHQDLRTRTARNQFWIWMGGLGLLFLCAEMVIDGREGWHFLVLPVLALLYVYPFVEFSTDRKVDIRSGIVPKQLFGACAALFVSMALIAGMESGFDRFYGELVATVIFIVIIYGLFYAGLLFGGGDAKAMMAIILMMPFYPDVGGFPLVVPPDVHARVIIYPLSVLFTGLVLMVFLPFVHLAMNLKRKDFKFPMLFFAYRMDIDRVAEKHVFLMEKVVEGKPKSFLFPPRAISLAKLKTVFQEMLEKATGGQEAEREEYTRKIKEITHMDELDEEKLELMRTEFEEFELDRLEKYFEKTKLPELRKLLVEHELGLLREAGKKEVWVSPKIPFLVPLTVSYGLSFFLGSGLFAAVEFFGNLW